MDGERFDRDDAGTVGLVATLGDDIAHLAAETELAALGVVAVPALWRTAPKRGPVRGVENENSRRRRLAALSVLL